MPPHDFAGFEHGTTVVATCTCGWRSMPALSERHGEARWRIHTLERSAARSIEEAVRLHEVVAQRAVELQALRLTMRDRRRDLRDQRWRIRAAAAPNHLDRPYSKRSPGSGQALDRARAMAGRPVTELWTAYLGRGGEMSLHELIRALGGEAGLGALDHDILAMTLNDWFSDAGFGRPLDECPSPPTLS